MAVALAAGFERSGWILITQPVEAQHAANSLIGFSYLRDATVLHKENLSALLQVAFFGGADVAPDLYFRRPVYTFAAASLAPALGPIGALVAMNFIAWAAGVGLTWRFTLRLYRDENAAAWAATLAAAGMGFTLHALDLSAHIFAFAFYMGGVVLIHESEAWRQRVGWRMHSAIGAYLALACLQYNTGLALAAAYVVVAARHNRVWLVLLSVVPALLVQPAWGMAMGAIWEHRHGTTLADLSSTEREYLQRALGRWAEIGGQPAFALVATARLLSQFASFEAPLVVLTGALAMLLDARRGAEGRERLFFALPFIAFPVLAAMVFAPGAGARGYLVYGIAIFFFAACGGVLARAIRRRRAVFLPAGIALVVLSILWTQAHLVNILGPAKAYFLGIDHAEGLFVPWEAASLTGQEPTPRLFGGSATLAEAGASRALPPMDMPVGEKARYSIAATALPALLVALFTGLLWRVRWWAGLAAGALLVAVPAAVGHLARIPPTVASGDAIVRLEAGTRLSYEIVLAEDIRRRLQAELALGRVVVLPPAGLAPPAIPQVKVGGALIPSSPAARGTIALDSTALGRALAADGGNRLAVIFVAAGESALSGWQRTDLPGRRLSGVVDSQALPAVELRVVRDIETMSPVLVAF
jgi:hypothetical protein